MLYILGINSVTQLVFPLSFVFVLFFYFLCVSHFGVGKDLFCLFLLPQSWPSQTCHSNKPTDTTHGQSELGQHRQCLWSAGVLSYKVGAKKKNKPKDKVSQTEYFET